MMIIIDKMYILMLILLRDGIMITTHRYFNVMKYFRSSSKGIYAACKQNDIEKLLHALGKFVFPYTTES